MARVELKSLGFQPVIDRRLTVQSGVGFTCNKPVYAASTGGAVLTGAQLASNADGEWPGWLEPGVTQITIPVTGKVINFHVGGMQDRTTTTETAVGLAADGQLLTTCVNLPAPGIRVFRILANRASRIRLYDTTDHRDADAARLPGVDPVGNHGCLLDGVLTAGMLDLTLSPAAETHTDSPIPMTIDNKDLVTGDVIVTFHYIKTEE